MAFVKELEALDVAGVQVIVRETSREGRLDQATIKGLAERARGAQWYLCGPASYVEAVGEMVRAVGIAREHIHVERFTPVGAAPLATDEARAALGRYVLAPPSRARRSRLVATLRRVGASLAHVANHRAPASAANPLRWLERAIGRAAGLDPAVPHELLAVISGLCNGPFAFQLRAFDRLRDGDTFAYWIPAVPFVRFPAPAVETGWCGPGEGRLVPVYITRSATAVERLLRSAIEIDRSPIPYHFVQQILGRTDQPSCPMRRAAGLIAGSFRHNPTWSDDRASTNETFAYASIEDFSDGIATSLDDVAAAIDASIDATADRVVDLDVLLCRIAHTVVVRAVFGDVQLPELDALGRALSDPVERLLAHVRHFAMGRRSIPSDYAECQRRARTTWRTMVDLLRDVDRRGGLSERAKARPTVRLLLETARDADSGYERLYTLFLPLIIAGHETTGHTLAWAFYELARDPRLERSILNEIVRFRAEHGREHLTPGDYDERPLTWALIAETLRRHPPVQSVARTALKPGVVPPDPRTGSGGFRFPSGAVFGISIVGVHLDPRRWPEPHAFRLTRWLSGIDDSMPLVEQGRTVRQVMRAREEACDWIPFAAGESRCPGHHFYTHEFFLVLDALLTRYRFEPTDPEREVTDSEAMVVGPEPGAMAVRIRRR
jgi:cytochrome P450